MILAGLELDIQNKQKKSSFCYKKPIFAFSFSRGATFSQLKALKRRFIAKVANL